MRKESKLYFFLQMDIQLFSTFFEKTCFSPLSYVGTLVKISWWKLKDLFLDTQSVPLVSMFILMTVPHYSWLLWLCNMFWNKEHFFSSFFQYCFEYTRFLELLYENFWMSLSISVEKAVGIFIGLVLDRQISFGSIANYISFLRLQYNVPQPKWPKQ